MPGSRTKNRQETTGRVLGGACALRNLDDRGADAVENGRAFRTLIDNGAQITAGSVDVAQSHAGRSRRRPAPGALFVEAMDDIERLSIRGPRFGSFAELQLGLRQQVREVIRVR